MQTATLTAALRQPPSITPRLYQSAAAAAAGAAQGAGVVQWLGGVVVDGRQRGEHLPPTLLFQDGVQLTVHNGAQPSCRLSSLTTSKPHKFCLTSSSGFRFNPPSVQLEPLSLKESNMRFPVPDLFHSHSIGLELFAHDMI